MPWRANPPLALVLLAVALVAAVLAASASGAVSIPLRELPSLLWGTPTPEQALWRNVLIDIRLPRVLLAVVMGAGLAISGAALQALFRNPLAEPGLIGISAGASLGAVIAIVMTHGGFWYTAPGAFIGSLVATLSAYMVGRRVPGVAGLLLAGVAITAIAFSLIGLFTFMASDAQLRDLTFWNMGSLAGASWKLLAFLGPWVLLLSFWLMRQWRVMNALLLGEREAQHLGYSLKQARARLAHPGRPDRRQPTDPAAADRPGRALAVGRAGAARPDAQGAGRHRRGAFHQLPVRRAVAASPTVHARPGPRLLRPQGHGVVPQQPHHHHRDAGVHADLRPALGRLGLRHAAAGGAGRPVAGLPGRALPARHRRRPAAGARGGRAGHAGLAPRRRAADRAAAGPLPQAAGPAHRAWLDPRLTVFHAARATGAPLAARQRPSWSSSQRLRCRPPP